jgi:hypothetical protein
MTLLPTDLPPEPHPWVLSMEHDRLVGHLGLLAQASGVPWNRATRQSLIDLIVERIPARSSWFLVGDVITIDLNRPSGGPPMRPGPRLANRR